jgi:DNA-binding GntR family transcriptional regulator
MSHLGAIRRRLKIWEFIQIMASTVTPRNTKLAGVIHADDDDSLQSAPDRAVEFITEGILEGRIVPGQRLIENDLTRPLGFSRGPVREAFRRLDAQGVLSKALNRGAYVRILTRREAMDLLLAVEPIGCLIATLAAEKIAVGTSAAERKQIEAALLAYQEGREDVSESPNQRRNFYNVLMSIGGNTQLPSILPVMRIHMLRLQIRSYLGAKDRKMHIVEYAAIAKAVLAGDVKTADKTMRLHLRGQLEMLAGLPDRAFPENQEK